MGRSNKYFTHVQPRLNEISDMYQFATETEIAKALHVSARSWENYKTQYPELKKALERGKQELVFELKKSMKRKALGYEYKEIEKQVTEVDGEKRIVIKEYTRYAQPDLGAQHLLLKNLDPTWRNDDQTTIELKKQKLELEKEKADNNSWT